MSALRSAILPLSILLSFSVGSCTPKTKSASSESSESKSPNHCDDCDSHNHDDDDDNGESPAAGLMGPAGLLALSSMFSQLEEPGLYDAPNHSEDFDEDDPHMAVMVLGGGVTELEEVSYFGGESSMELRTIQDRLDALRRSEEVRGLLLRTDGLQVNMATADALRRSMLDFRKGDGEEKTIHCHSEGLENLGYFVMSACTTITLAPTGGLVVSGVAAMPMHLKGLLDKLGIKADFLHVGDYKGAAEPLTLDRPSKAMEETISGILDGAFSQIVGGIAEGRNLSPETVKTLVDTALFSDTDAVAAKLVDGIATYEQFLVQRSGALPWGRVAWEEEKEEGMGALMKILGATPRTRDSDDHVAVFYAVGNIIDGAGDGLIGSREEIASRTVVPVLRSLMNADSVKAVVVRVDSGGGSALASEIIWQAMNELGQKKPVVVSMGSVAASGGYYISAAANRIFAEENTLTGSIGVVGGKLAIGGALEKIGVTSFPMGRGKRSTMWSALGAWNADERAAIQKSMEDVYKVFVQRVATGRKMEYAAVHKVAQGRVWTGRAALENGLVDEIGGLDDAIAHAMMLAEMEESGELEIYPPKPTLMDFIKGFAGDMQVTASTSFGVEATALREVGALLGPQAELVLGKTLRQLRSFQKSQIQTTMILPVLWQ